MATLPRGIDPQLLISQVKNTIPYFSSLAGFVPAQRLFELSQAGPGALANLEHLDYFKLCLYSHYLTVATPVPTDVDNQIRQKLWPRSLPLETALAMAALVLESRDWDFTLVSRRFVRTPQGILIGHKGEWFTVAAGAYSALKQYKSREAALKAEVMREAVREEVKLHSEIFGALWRAGDGLGALKGSAVIAHNFGDLDRVMDMWELDSLDPFRLEFYKLSANPFDANRKLRHLGRLWVAGELYKSTIEGSSMALENHRHFALRRPRALRQNPELMITTGPFLEGWGRRVAKLLDDPLEVIEALQNGWARLPKTVGYGRALRGILEVLPDLPIVKLPKEILKETEEKFERKWSDAAVRLIEEIPARAGS